MELADAIRRHLARYPVMADYPIRQKSADGQPAEESPVARTCRRCKASFRGLAPGKTGERGLWLDWQWYCSQECYDLRAERGGQ